MFSRDDKEDLCTAVSSESERDVGSGHCTQRLWRQVALRWYFVVMLDGRWRRSSVGTLWNGCSVRWVSDSLRLRYRFALDKGDILSALTITWRKPASVSTATTSYSKALTEPKQILVIYGCKHQEDCCAYFSSSHVGCIADDTIFFNFLALSYKAIYSHDITSGQISIKNGAVLHLFVFLGKEMVVVRTLGINYVDYASVYLTSNVANIKMFHTADMTFRNDYYAIASYADVFY